MDRHQGDHEPQRARADGGRGARAGGCVLSGARALADGGARTAGRPGDRAGPCAAARSV
ncbi:Hypothethical protein [Burkholderia multivorans]